MRSSDRTVGRLGERGPTEDNRDIARDGTRGGSDRLCTESARGFRGTGGGSHKGSGNVAGLTRTSVERMGGDTGKTTALRCDLDQRGAVFDNGVAQAQVERTELFLRVGTD